MRACVCVCILVLKRACLTSNALTFSVNRTENIQGGKSDREHLLKHVIQKIMGLFYKKNEILTSHKAKLNMITAAVL